MTDPMLEAAFAAYERAETDEEKLEWWEAINQFLDKQLAQLQPRRKRRRRRKPTQDTSQIDFLAQKLIETNNCLLDLHTRQQALENALAALCQRILEASKE